MRQEKEPSPEKLRKFTKKEEALEGLKKDLEHGLSISNEEFQKEKEETLKELGIEELDKKKEKE